ncbi:MAG: Inner-rane translocator [Deltaproteobacteria bacterium]|nr:Inner-rane translocator [Deltaproteobacteria bacterium]
MIRPAPLSSGWATQIRGGWLAAGIGLLLLFPLSYPDAYLLDVLTTGFLLAAFAASWDVVGGIAGQVTLGHALPFGAATYACALLTRLAGWPFPLAAAAAVLLATAAGAGVGQLASPLSGPFVAVLTLALAEAAHEIAAGHAFLSGPGGYAWGGEGGIPVVLPWGDAPPIASYYAALAFLCLSTWGILRFSRSESGLVLRAVAGSPLTAQASGVPIGRFRRLAFIVGSAFAGAAGAGYAAHVGRATAGDLSLELSFQAATFAAVGGRGTVVGPVVAALALHALFQGLSLPPAARVLLYAGTLLVTLRFFPGGVAGTAREVAARLRSRDRNRGGRRRRGGEAPPGGSA